MGCRSQAVEAVGGLQVEPGLLGIEDEPPIAGEPSSEALDQAIQQAFEALPVRRTDAMEARPATIPAVDPIEHQHVQVHIQVQRAAESLDEGDDASAGAVGGLHARMLREVGLYCSGDHGQATAQSLRPAGRLAKRMRSGQGKV